MAFFYFGKAYRTEIDDLCVLVEVREQGWSYRILRGRDVVAEKNPFGHRRCLSGQLPDAIGSRDGVCSSTVDHSMDSRQSIKNRGAMTRHSRSDGHSELLGGGSTSLRYVQISQAPTNACSLLDSRSRELRGGHGLALSPIRLYCGPQVRIGNYTTAGLASPALTRTDRLPQLDDALVSR